MPLLSPLLDQPSPPLLAAEAMGDLPARRQGAIGLTVLQCPRPGVQLHLRRRAFISPVLTHNTLVITRSPGWHYLQMQPLLTFVRGNRSLIFVL